jgi:DNA-binding transcriptional ArsR family regulator
MAQTTGEPDPNDVRHAAKIFKALSHPQRLRIVCKLSDGRVTSEKELIEEFAWPQSTVNRHLSTLRGCGLVSAKRNGTRMQVKLSGPTARLLMDAVCAWVHPETGERLSGTLALVSGHLSDATRAEPAA